ncbi:MAG: FHA domain-containing protein [Acidobacteriota bacterium]
MLDAIIKFDGREMAIDRDVTTIGRTSENIVSFPNDSNVSRYHAEIERRGGDHWLIDLNSSNGTTVNGKELKGDIRLEQGDKLVFGGTSTAEFLAAASMEPEAEAGGSEIDDAGMDINVPGMSAARSEISGIGYQAQNEVEYAAVGAVRHGVSHAVSGAASSGAASTAGTAASSSGSTVLVAGAVVGLAVVCAVAAGAFYMTRGSACAAEATITQPETGDSISSPVEIQLDAKNAGCVQRAVFTIDGKEVAKADAPLFEATLDPKDMPELADGVDHALQVTLVDSTGIALPQAGSVLVAFETRVVAKALPTQTATTSSTPAVKTSGRGQPSLVQIYDMSQRLVKEFSGKLAYNLSNKQFLAEVQKRSAEYAQDGFSQRAAAYREVIIVAFTREQNIDAPLGFILAMSRSKFVPVKQGEREGLWQLPTAMINENKYNGQCGTETLSDPSQNCAARSAALYLKAILYGAFEGDPIYSAAAFGKSPQDAAAWKATLPQNRSDVWTTIKTADEREQLIRFFAAGIVAENPPAFGLTKDRPLSELYRVTQ